MKNKAHRTIDIESWDRRDHYYFFKDYDDPCFCLTANVDVTNLIINSKKKGHSIFLKSLYMVSKAINEVTELRIRIDKDEEVLIYDKIDIGCAILKDDNTFLFAYMDYKGVQMDFMTSSAKIIEQTKQMKQLNSRAEDLDLIHCSVLPWVSFTAIKHPRDYDVNSSIPKVMIGKFFQEGDKYLMPISLQVHHALVDGYHVGLFYKAVEEIAKEG